MVNKILLCRSIFIFMISRAGENVKELQTLFLSLNRQSTQIKSRAIQNHLPDKHLNMKNVTWNLNYMAPFEILHMEILKEKKVLGPRGVWGSIFNANLKKRQLPLAPYIYSYRYSLPKNSGSLQLYDFQGWRKWQGPPKSIILDSWATKLLKFKREK